MWSTLDSFYKSRQWQGCREDIIKKRLPECEHCKKTFKNGDTIIAHHKTELTLANVNDYMISLNPENIALVHATCHSAIHGKRYGYNHYKKKLENRKIYLVYGPPLSGKTSFVLENKNEDDIVIDIDRIYEALTLLPAYNKPKALLPNVLAVRDTLINNLKVRYGRFNNAWIVGGYADKYQRDSIINSVGATPILINPGKETCLKRLERNNNGRNIVEWQRYIEEWYKIFIP